jgi:hypothetical protein
LRCSTELQVRCTVDGAQPRFNLATMVFARRADFQPRSGRQEPIPKTEF